MTLTPILQLIHVSDLHVVANPRLKPRSLRLKLASDQALQAVRSTPRVKALRSLDATIRQGIEPADHAAMSALRRFLPRLLAFGDGWDRTPRLLVDTGDLTVFGDDASMRMGGAYEQNLARQLGCRVLALHGNHDAWPGDLPLFARGRIESARWRLRGNWYRETAPGSPWTLEVELPREGLRRRRLRIDHYWLNTVVHDAVRNTRALGEVAEDRFWRHGADQARSDIQVSELLATARARARDGVPTLRLIAMHHPLLHPELMEPEDRMVLTNRVEIKNALGRATTPFHVVLSGHTHALSPALGSLPGSPSNGGMVTMHSRTVQLVVGSLLQRDLSKRRGAHPQQVQVLRLSAAARGRATEVVLERLVGVREDGRGDFGLARVAGTDQAHLETCTFTI